MNRRSLLLRLYSALLVLYPRDFRREYGPEMTRLFHDTCRDAYRQGGAAAVVLWCLSTLIDLLLTALQERRKAASLMDFKLFLSRHAGYLLIAGGALTILASVSQLQPDNHVFYYGVYQLALLLMLPAYTLIAFGILGLITRIGEASGLIGRLSLYLAGSGALAAAMGFSLTQANSFFWVLGFVGIAMHTFGLGAFGLLHLWKPSLPIFRALPLQMAGGWVILMLIASTPPAQQAANALTFMMFVGVGLAWIAIGNTLHRQSSGVVRVEAAA